MYLFLYRSFGHRLPGHLCRLHVLQEGDSLPNQISCRTKPNHCVAKGRKFLLLLKNPFFANTKHPLLLLKRTLSCCQNQIPCVAKTK